MCRHPSLAALGRNLRASRRKRGLTQEKLARLAELDPTYISGIERGINPSLLASSNRKGAGRAGCQPVQGGGRVSRGRARRRAARAGRAVPGGGWGADRSATAHLPGLVLWLRWIQSRDAAGWLLRARSD